MFSPDPNQLFRVSPPFAHDTGCGDVEKRGVALRGHSFGQHRLPCAWFFGESHHIKIMLHTKWVMIYVLVLNTLSLYKQKTERSHLVVHTGVNPSMVKEFQWTVADTEKSGEIFARASVWVAVNELTRWLTCYMDGCWTVLRMFWDYKNVARSFLKCSKVDCWVFAVVLLSSARII